VRPVEVNLVLDDEELATFLAGPYPRVLRAVALICDSAPAAQDAVHEALARAWEHRDTIEHLDRWVLTVALNLARGGWRKIGRRGVPLAEAPSASSAPPAEWVDLHRAVEALPRRQREVVVLHYFVDLSVDHVAGLLGISDGAVKHALFSARRSLGRAVGPGTTTLREPR
jgi:RNA polymerase sigma-70 factor, ECF subfamily